MCNLRILWNVIGNNMKEDYKVIKGFADADTCNRMVEKLDDFYKKGYNLPPDNQCPSSPTFYGIFNDESKLWLPKIEELVEKKLFPTYTYSRIYTKNEALNPHIDRFECEYSFTLTLKYDKNIWPIYVQSGNRGHEILLDVGDILIYKGVKNLHWRHALENDFHYQGFFHYVDKQGPYSDRRFDGRHSFASTQEVIDEVIRRRNVLQQ